MSLIDSNSLKVYQATPDNRRVSWRSVLIPGPGWVYLWWIVGEGGQEWETGPSSKFCRRREVRATTTRATMLLLTGTYRRTLDSKNRLVFPAQIRKQLFPGQEQLTAQRLFVTPGQDCCLWIYTPAALERLAEKLDQAPTTDAEVRMFRRLFLAETELVELDSAGRILLPARLTQFAGLRQGADRVVMIGVGDRLEVWDAQRWQEYQNQNASRFDAVAEGAFKK